MYPAIVDMNENESSKYLRMLELDAYSNVLAALRAQGPPTSDKLKLLKDVGSVLRIPQERCKAEIRKVILDERLNTIAYFSCGQVETADDWIKEGRRLISLMPRVAPQTLYSAIADEVANAASISNEQLPLPAHTDRKRSTTAVSIPSNVSDSIKSTQFKVPELFKNEDSRKRKLSFGVENNTLAQHLIGPSKVSCVQQIYRQRVKSKKEQLQSKAKQQDLELQEFKHTNTHPARIMQQFQQKMQKITLPVQSPTSSPKINILQNISLQPITKGEETIEQIKNEINSFMVQRGMEQNNSSPQPGCSNENQAPKLQQKQTLVNIKPNHNITYKHVASPGPSSDLQKSLKVCSTTRKGITKTVPGQKLIIVSNAQSISTSSILQRTLTIPFVKNISVKNFDKFKIVSTGTNTTNLQLTSLSNSNTFSTNSAKHKVVTVRTNPTTKKIIPLAHLQALNAKGSIKMLPVGGKILSKAPITTGSSVYIMNNSCGLQQALTKSTSSTSIVMTCRAQDSVPENIENEISAEESEKEVVGIEETEVESNNEIVETANESEFVNNKDVTSDFNILLDDNAKSSDVITDEHVEDIESKISQLTAIPQPLKQSIEVEEFEEVESTEVVNYQDANDEIYNNGSNYVFLGDKDQETERLLKDLEGDDSSDIVYENINSSNNDYTIEKPISEVKIETDGTFSMTVQNSSILSDTVI